MAYKYVEQVQYKKLSTKANKGNYRALATRSPAPLGLTRTR